MARIELRNTTIRLKDGLNGTAAVAQPLVVPGMGDTTLKLGSIVLNTTDTDLVPVGARFALSSETDTTVVHTVTARTPSSGSPTTDITFTPALGAGTYTTSAAGIVGAATTTTPGTSGVDEVQSIARFANNVTSGNFTLTIDLAVEPAFTTANIAHNANAATIEGAIDTAATLASVTSWANGDISVTGGPLTTTAIVLTYDGDSVDEQNHAQATIASVSLSATVGTGALDFDSQQLAIKIGEGELKYTETSNYIYDLDKGNLDTVRQGDEAPMDISLSFTYEHITTGTNELIAPMDAIKRIGSASEWVSSSADLCEPYAIDVEVEHVPPCGTNQSEFTTFPDFRADKKDVSFKDALITISGKCNATEPIVERV